MALGLWSVPSAQPAATTPPRAATTPNPTSNAPGASPAPIAGVPESKAGAAPAKPGASGEWERRSARFGGYEWITRPSQDATMSFSSPIEVSALRVKGGQVVKAGQTLVQGRDSEARVALDVQQLRGKNDTDVRNAKVNLDLAKSRFDAAKKARESEALADAEYDERRTGFDSAKIAVEAAELKLKEEQLRAVQLERQLERYRIDAPFDGIVQEVMAEVGQTLDDKAPAVRLISIDPLYVDVPVRTEETVLAGLSPGKPAWLLLDLPGEAVVLQGKVQYVSPAADAASGTRRVRIEAGNPALLPTGTRARVRFDEPPTSWNAPAQAGAQGATR